MRKFTLIAITLTAICWSLPNAFGQQEKGNKEVGIGGQLLATHTKNFTGSAAFQFSVGYFASDRNYFGFEVDPTVTFSRTETIRFNNQVVQQGGSNTEVGGFFGANYRRMFGNPKGRIFPFAGGGGGGYISGGSGGTSTAGTVYPELGLKSYISQKTSLEFAYKMLYTPSGGGGFQDKSISLLTISIRHIF